MKGLLKLVGASPFSLLFAQAVQMAELDLLLDHLTPTNEKTGHQTPEREEPVQALYSLEAQETFLTH